MIKKNIFIGNFGGFGCQMDGQTVKTQNVKSILEKLHEGELVEIIDTYQLGSLQLISKLPIIILKVLQSRVVYLAMGIRGITTLGSFILCISLIFNKKINYFVIGGWLPSLVRRNVFIRFLFCKFTNIFIETRDMVKQLEDLNFTNTKYLPNFRDDFDFTPDRPKFNCSSFKLVFYSRVMQEKGIFDAIELVSKLNCLGFNCLLDVYGPLIDLNKTDIETNKFVKYKGMLNPQSDQIYSILSQYDLMVFPTYYSGEGFPGAIVDSFIAGLPVLASDWKFNSEIVKNNHNGFLYPLSEIDVMIDIVVKYIENYELQKSLRFNCHKDSEEFKMKNILITLNQIINIKGN